MIQKVEEIKHTDGSAEKNRIGILLGNKKQIIQKKEVKRNLTINKQSFWSYYILPANQFQKPHRNNSVILFFC